MTYTFQQHRARVESRRAISIFEMQRASNENHRILTRYGFWTKSGIHLEWKKAVGDSYIELVSRGPHNTQSTFNLVTTPCNYGGKRWWLECPNCQRRVAKLYENNDNFACRICLDLEYSSHRQNYRGIGPMIRRMLKYEEAKRPRVEYSFYKGRPTKRVQREEKLRMQVEYSTPYVLSTVRKWSA
ncbi:MAG TPA: hypothetical protein VMR46_01860 [Candidatus Paceibacterota bacterium]|nr:hypothetical protein [Candidatus Paceibacterota bacterium]